MTKDLQSRELDHHELLARQGLRFPAIILRHLRSAGIYCQPTVSIEHQHLAKRYVLRAGWNPAGPWQIWAPTLASQTSKETHWPGFSESTQWASMACMPS